MPRLIAVTGATGNQGGSVAKYLLQFPHEYSVRCLTRDPSQAAAQKLEELGAEVVKADLTKPEALTPALEGCWGVFGVTNFYDSTIINDPASEEQQGKNLIDASLSAETVKCFIWSTLPSSIAISNGKYCSQIYENKYKVDTYMRQKGVEGPFFYTGNFFENSVLRGHVKLGEGDREGELVFRQPVIEADTQLAMLYVEKDLSQCVKVAFDKWDSHREFLNWRYFYVANMRISPREYSQAIEKVSGRKCTYVVIPTTGVPDRDIMFQLYNAQGMYGIQEIPDPNLLELGVKFHTVEDFIRDRLLPHLGIEN